MQTINVLPFEIANLIAAGEVVDRPASVAKELIENALDAGASHVTCEIKAGGVTLIRVTDDGSGMSAEDLPLSIRRHATSKIRTADDLSGILTLGFRGEALAAISSVSRMTLITKTADAASGYMLTADGGRVTDLCEVGCADGTTVVVEDLFGRVPARKKFLKRDRTEAMAVSALVERMALSRPDVVFRFVSDEKVIFTTPGDGDVAHTLYAINGRAFAEALLPVSFSHGGVTVTGYIGAAENDRGNRGFQNVFINRRYVRSKTAVAALEEAYTSYIAPGRYPVCCLYLTLDCHLVDVNVHPSKMEVRFSDERPVFEAVYWAVRGALERDVTRPDLGLDARASADPAYRAGRLAGAFVPVGGLPRPQQLSALGADERPAPPTRVAKSGHDPARSASAPTYADPASSAALLRDLHRQADASGLFTLRQTPVSEGPLPDGFPASPRATGQEAAQTPSDTPAADGSACPPLSSDPASVRPTGASDDNQSLQNDLLPPPPPAVSAPFATDAPAPTEQQSAAPWRLIGVAFDCYLLVECGEELLIIDQHAAHERILFEEMLAARQNGRIASQSLLVGIGIRLAPDLLSVLLDQEADLRSLGYTFRVEDDHTATLTGIPSDMTPDAAAAFFSELAQQMASCGAEPYLCDQKRRERTLYQMACKAAIKGGRTYDHAHLLWLIDRLRELPDITLCPHGRPVAVRLSHRQLDHRFDRL